jgi:hypothetical protein
MPVALIAVIHDNADVTMGCDLARSPHGRLQQRMAAIEGAELLWNRTSLSVGGQVAERSGAAGREDQQPDISPTP